MAFGRLFAPFALLLAAAVVLPSCSPKETSVYSREAETPPDSTLDIQGLIDATPDGGKVKIPKGRFVLHDGLILSGRNNLTIECAPGSQILVTDISADVLEIANCGDITLKGAFLRHLKPLPHYECHGDVLKIRNSHDVTVQNCELDGSGAIGVSAWGSKSIFVTHCLIQHNSFNALYFDGCEMIRVKNCIIRDNASFMQLYGTSDLEMWGNTTEGNGGYWEKSEDPGLED